MLITTNELKALQKAVDFYRENYEVDIVSLLKTKIFSQYKQYYLLDKSVKIKYTEQEIDMLKKCAGDIEFYANQRFTLVSTEKEMLNAYLENDISINICARQTGETFISNTIITHEMIFKDYYCLYLLSNKYKFKNPSKDIIEYFASNNPFLQVPLKITKNKITIYNENPYSGRVSFETNISNSFKYDLVYLNELNIKHINLIIASNPNAKIIINCDSSIDSGIMTDEVLDTLNFIASEKNKKISINVLDNVDAKKKKDPLFGHMFTNPLYLKNKIGNGVVYGNRNKN